MYHVSTCENLSFGPVTPITHSLLPGNLNTVCYHLMFDKDDDSLLDNNTLHTRMDHHSPQEHPMAHHLTSADEEEDKEEEDAEEHFPTAPLIDDVWIEEPVPDRHLCIHEHSQHNLCPYPCPYSLDQLHLTLDYTPQYMDLSDILDFQDVITTASNEYIPNLKDVLKL